MNKRIWTTLCVAGLLFGISAIVSPDRVFADKPSGRVPPTAEMCALLDNPRYAGRMDGLLNYLAKGCGREAEFFGTVAGEANEPGVPADAPFGVDVAVSNPSGDLPPDGSHTQSETSIARNETTGTVCAAWNDSQHGIGEGLGFTGFGRSTNGGASFVDRGAVSVDDSGDPSLVWRKSDGKFYYAALSGSGGLALYRSDDDCTNFVFVSAIASGSDDKEIMAVDNNPANPSYGYLYVVWTDFGSGAQIFATRSTNAGASWSAQVALSAGGEDVQGAWPVVAPNGHVYAGWVHWMSPGFPNGNVEAQISRSTDGGATWGLVTPPMTNQINPQNATASSNCGRPALNGNIRYLPSPTIAVDSLGRLHAVYTYDAAGFGTGDSSNVYYRRSTDGGATWGTQAQINDDGTATDQYQPSLSIGAGDVLAIGYYSRQNDVANNLLLDYYSRVSYDGGGAWQASTRLSDVSTPVFIDPNLASCYHGDYDTQIHVPGKAIYLWSDDRNVQGGHNDPDIYSDSTLAGVDFLISPGTTSQTVCKPADAVYSISVPGFQGFAETINLSATGNPAGTTVGFVPPSVSPGGSSTLTLGTASVAAYVSAVVTVTGTSTPGGIVHSSPVDLTVFTLSPAAPSLTSPTPGQVNVALKPTFTWGAPPEGAAIYEIQVDDDAGFGSPEFATTVSTPSATPGADLASNTLFHWRVRATNTCGAGSFSATQTFTTVPAPGDCGTGSAAALAFIEGFEGGAAGWVSSGTMNTWAQSAARVHSGTSSWQADGLGVVSDQRLVSPAVALPSGQDPLSLVFWNHQTIEPNGAACYDGAIVEVSPTGGDPWTQLVAPALLTDPYNGPVSTCCSNPLQNLNAWCGDPQDWTKSVVDVTAYAGQTIYFRFRLGTDSSVAREGWYLDDVTVQSCFVGLIFEDGFDGGDRSRWDFTTP